MYSFVCSQMRPCIELFFTKGTREWFFAGMHAFVNVEAICIAELLITNITDNHHGVSSNDS